MSKKSYPGVNIQWPISELILSGEKTVETRTYPLPDKYLNQELVLIETPGPKGKFKARTKAIILFTECFLYKDKKMFRSDFRQHRVSEGSPWDWIEKPKWGWRVFVKTQLPSKVVLKKGICFTKSVKI